jgi:membrane-bound serine protease (ClpP class)
MVHIGRSLARTSVVFVVVACALFTATPALSQPSAVVYVVQVEGVIDPPVARYVIDRLERAADASALAVILQIDTPGGLQVSNRALVDAVAGSPVPVVAWVAPRDARAASVGALLVYAADLVYLADSTQLGPLAPATLDGDGDAATRAARELLLDLASRPGAPLVASRAVTSDNAVASRYVDGSASSLRDLLQRVDQANAQINGRWETLETWDEAAGTPSVTIRFAQMDPFQRLLHAVTDPKVALLLFLAGLFGLIFELYNPGIGLAAIVGAGCLVLSIYSLSVLPTNWAALLVVTAGIGLLLLDLHAAALGPASALGLIGLGGGSAFLFSGSSDALSLSPLAIAAAVVVTIVFFVSVMTAALRVRLRRPVSDEEGLVGSVGEATTDIAPEGTVLTKGTLWRARTMETGIAAGAKVEIKATEGLVLLVEPLHEHAGSPDADD